MMQQRGYRFDFEVPDDWASHREGNRFIYHGPLGQELIVSGAILEGTGSEAEVASMRDALVKNAMDAMARSADHPDLVTVKALREDPGSVTSEQLRCWTIHSNTKGGDVLFSQAVVASDVGILLLTFESANLPTHLALYRTVLKTIRPALTQ